MDVAAENAPSCTKPQLYWFPLKAPVEGLWKDWAGTMAESRAQFSQRLQFSSSPYPLSIFQDEITSHWLLAPKTYSVVGGGNVIIIVN